MARDYEMQAALAAELEKTQRLNTTMVECFELLDKSEAVVMPAEVREKMRAAVAAVRGASLPERLETR